MASGEETTEEIERGLCSWSYRGHLLKFAVRVTMTLHGEICKAVCTRFRKRFAHSSDSCAVSSFLPHSCVSTARESKSFPRQGNLKTACRQRVKRHSQSSNASSLRRNPSSSTFTHFLPHLRRRTRKVHDSIRPRKHEKHCIIITRKLR